MNATTPAISPLAGLPHIDLGPTIGVDLIGLVFAAVFFGITTLQTLFYYRTYTEDGFLLKFLVAFLWVMDGLSLALLTHGVYTYLITDYGNPIALTSLVWSITNEPIVTAIVSLIVHWFMAYRIHILNRAWTPFALVIAAISLFPMAVAIYTLYISDTGSSAFTALTKLHWTAYAGDVSTTCIDLSIAAVISFLLYQNRNGFQQTDRMLNKLTLYVLTNGLITSTLTTATLIAYAVAPTKLYFQMINMSVSKAYTNTMLATLNSRRSLRETSSYASQGLSGVTYPFKAATNSRLDSSGVTGSVVGTSTLNDHVIPLESFGRSPRDTKHFKSEWA